MIVLNTLLALVGPPCPSRRVPSVEVRKRINLYLTLDFRFCFVTLGFEEKLQLHLFFCLERLNQPEKTSVESYCKRNSPTFKTSVVKAGEVVLLLGCKTLVHLKHGFC